jgi:hypothetical protein
MPQGDLVVANQSGAAFRSDVNAQLLALGTLQSGAAQPSTTYAYQWWADTTTGLLKLRNAANNAWITLFQLDGEWTTLALENGTAAAPSLYFKDSGTDTGLFSPGADQLGIATGGVERVEFGTTEVVFNDGGADVDFRIEGDTNPDLFKIDAGLDQVQVANLNGGPLAGFRNLLINANPTINQRGYVSGAATSVAFQYTLDRWRVVTSGQSITWTDSANVRTVTAPAGGCEQLIEGLNLFTGTYTLSWTGTATATVGGSSVANGGNFSLTGDLDTTVRFSSGTFSRVQLEPGAVATPFEQRPIGTELALCQRYFEALNGGTIKAAGEGPTGSEGSRQYFGFATTKRVAPTMAYPSASQANCNLASNSATNGFNVTATIVSTGTFGYDYAAGNVTASAEL